MLLILLKILAKKAITEIAKLGNCALCNFQGIVFFPIWTWEVFASLNLFHLKARFQYASIWLKTGTLRTKNCDDGNHIVPLQSNESLFAKMYGTNFHKSFKTEILFPFFSLTSHSGGRLKAAVFLQKRQIGYKNLIC